MSLERYGLGALITADDKPFVAAANRSRDSLGRFIQKVDQTPAAMARMSRSVNQSMAQIRRGTSQMAAGFSKLGGGLRNAAMGALPLTVAMGAGAAKAAKFEKQMSAVGSITRSNSEDMAKLNKEAQRMGIVSVFSATQAGEGMEYLARAGANADQIIAALQGTMNAAAADSIELATASDIVAQVVKGMGMEWGEAGHVADVLALASASANTNITQLGESFKYGVSQAKALGISLEASTAIFGKLADAGLKGSIAGTSFTNMMNKLVRPSSKSQKQLKKWGIVLDDSNGKLRKVSDIVAEVNSKISELPKASERAAWATEIFGLRGAKAYNALSVAGKASLDALEDSLIASSAGIGAATEMANARLDNFLGRITLFGSSIESLSIGIFGPLLKAFTPVAEQMTASLNNVLFSLQGLSEMRQKENQENAQSAIMIAAEAANRLKAAGATEEYARSSKSALQSLSRLAIGEEKLSSAQLEARKRAVLSTIEAESTRRAEIIKTNHLEAAGVQAIEQLGEERKKFMLKQIDAMKKARNEEVKGAIDTAFRGAEGAAEAQIWLRKRVLQEALASNKDLSEAQRRQIEEEISNLVEVEAARSAAADKVRAQIFSIEKLQEIEEKHGTAAVQIALGLQDAIDTLIEAWDSLVDKVKELGQTLEEKFGKDGVRKITKYATIFMIVAAAIVPLLLALSMFGFMLGGLGQSIAAFKTIAMGAISVIKGAVMLLAGSFWPLVLVLGAVALAFAFIRKDGESVGETFTRVWGNIKDAVTGFYNDVFIPFINGFRAVWNSHIHEVGEKWTAFWDSTVGKVEAVVGKIKERFNAIFGSWFQGLDQMEVKWDMVGGALARGIMEAAKLVIDVLGGVVDAFVWVMDAAWNLLEGPLQMFATIGDVIIANWESVKTTFIGLWNIISETFGEVVAEIKLAIGDLANEFLGAGDSIGFNWIELGRIIGSVVLATVTTVVKVIGVMVRVIGKIISALIPIFKTPIITIKRAFEDMFGGILQMLSGDFTGGLKRIGIAIFNALTMPIRSVIGVLLKLIRMIPGADELAGKFGISMDGIQKWMETGITSDEMAASLEKTLSAKPTIKVAAKGAENVNAAAAKDAAKIAMDPLKSPDAARLAGMKEAVDGINDLKTREKKRQMQVPKVEAQVNLEDKRSLDIKNSMCVDGENMDVATARHKQEVQERAGFKATPWQRRVMLEQGAAPVKGVA